VGASRHARVCHFWMSRPVAVGLAGCQTCCQGVCGHLDWLANAGVGCARPLLEVPDVVSRCVWTSRWLDGWLVRMWAHPVLKWGLNKHVCGHLRGWLWCLTACPGRRARCTPLSPSVCRVLQNKVLWAFPTLAVRQNAGQGKTRPCPIFGMRCHFVFHMSFGMHATSMPLVRP